MPHAPCRSTTISRQHERTLLFLLVLAGTLGFGSASELLRPVLPLLACSCMSVMHLKLSETRILHRLCSIAFHFLILTYVAVCSLSQSSLPCRTLPTDNAARISSSPRPSHKVAQNPCSYPRHIASGSRRRKPDPSLSCTTRRACRGVHLSTHWGGLGGGHHCQ